MKYFKLFISITICLGLTVLNFASPMGSSPASYAPKYDDSNVSNSYLRKYPLTSLKKVTIPIGRKDMHLYIMDTPEKQVEGLGYLLDWEFKSDEAMLFPYHSPKVMNFAMNNVRIPVDVAFLDEDKKVMRIERMDPENMRYKIYPSTCSSIFRAQYALVAKRGAFDTFKIGTYYQVPIPNNIKAKRHHGRNSFGSFWDWLFN